MGLQLINSVNLIIEKVRQITQKDIEFIEDDKLETYASIKIARKDMPAHRLFYKAEHDELINHLIAHECGHIIRTFMAPDSKRIIPFSDQETKKIAFTEMENDIHRLSQALDVDILGKVLEMWYSGIIRQLTNYPPDIMIEKWLYDNYPELRLYQMKSIEKQREDAVNGLSEKVRSFTPTRIFDASNLMNYAFFRILGIHFGVNYVKPFNNGIILSKGKIIAGIIENSKKDDLETDIKMINKWAEYFGFQKWFRWTSFENIPEGYLRTP